MRPNPRYDAVLALMVLIYALEEASLGEGLLQFSLPILFYMENQYKKNK
jgi:hypothetical protein